MCYCAGVSTGGEVEVQFRSKSIELPGAGHNQSVHEAAGTRLIVTFGHGTASLDRIAELLRSARVRKLIDVRTAPGSRHNPDVARAELERRLPQHGVDYRWEKRLGGWRKARPDAPDSALRNRSFAGYAAYMRSHQFREAVDTLEANAESQRVAIMCAEALWWRCHRKMIADFLVIARGWRVLHLFHDATLHEHIPSRQARLVPETGLLVYDRI